MDVASDPCGRQAHRNLISNMKAAAVLGLDLPTRKSTAGASTDHLKKKD